MKFRSTIVAKEHALQFNPNITFFWSENTTRLEWLNAKEKGLALCCLIIDHFFYRNTSERNNDYRNEVIF